MSKIIELNGIKKSFGKFQALSDVTFSVRKLYN